MKEHSMDYTPTSPPEPEWETQLAALWKELGAMDGVAFREAMRKHIGALPEGHPVALFEMGAACDSTGLPEDAVKHYEAALEAGLSGIRRRRVRIQLASSLRNLGSPQLAADMLFEELKQPHDELDQAVAAFLALALADLGREREGLAMSLKALSTYLPRYNRSLGNYAERLNAPESEA
ncbi:MAG: tetratricopeptide repeat protein [Candidatus Eisenbacteria bacterium]